MSPNTLTRTLAIKERLRQWRRAELHEADGEVARAQQHVDEHAAHHQLASAEITAEREVSAQELALHAEQLERAQRALHKARELLAAREVERESRREQVGEATREVKAIEALRERVLEEARREAGLREQRDMDENSARKGGRRP
ncbi:MAG TPA: flagellar FliJ family protein [Polyangiales bacterium]|nr:flagellar FliJ family protein [Polyangiales bacterium]